MKTKEQKKQYKITYVGDLSLNNIHHIGLEYNGSYYSVIFGEYINGGFFSIPNWNVGGELADLDDVFWNAESIESALKNKNVAKVIAEMIADVSSKYEKRNGG